MSWDNFIDNWEKAINIFVRCEGITLEILELDYWTQEPDNIARFLYSYYGKHDGEYSVDEMYKAICRAVENRDPMLFPELEKGKYQERKTT